ncbi:MAG TPA: NfeD family protein [Candidatus Altiarchaeales archaeon]|nr:NfeD family protein [Candidatus Altiarchaeales archaeon]
MAGFEVWLGVAIIFFIGEMFTEGFFLLWFGIGALFSAIIAFFGITDNVTQWVVFLIVSSVLVLLTRRFAKKITKKPPREAAVDALVGKEAKVIETIDLDNDTGRIKIKGDEWRAEADEVIPEGEKVQIIRIEGTHVIVKKL